YSLSSTHSVGSIVLSCTSLVFVFCFFFFNDPSTPEIYTLSLHDALPILADHRLVVDRQQLFADDFGQREKPAAGAACQDDGLFQDRKSTRLNSSHRTISYAVFCLKKKKKQITKTLG